MKSLRLVCVLGILAYVCASKDPIETLYDLSSDPKEHSDLSTNADYADTLSDMKAKLEAYRSAAKPPQIPSSHQKSKTFESCGGVCPWADSEKIVKGKKDQTTSKTFYTHDRKASDDAPHVVMVLIEDWGFNQAGYTSNYMNWVTPVIDDLKEKSVSFANYFTHPKSIPSRGALLTGKYASNIGLWGSDSYELTADDSTIAEELQNLGYKTYMVGQWGLGVSSSSLTPLNRGFDYFYGHLSDSVNPYTKKNDGYLDLYDNDKLETDPDALSSDLHTAMLFQSKVTDIISSHAINYGTAPMFLYYSIPGLRYVDSPYRSPSQYLSHCEEPSISDISDEFVRSAVYNYCGLNAMINEVMGNLTCALQNAGMDVNTVMIVTSDNGGDNEVMPGVNYPFFGGKGYTARGGISVNALFYDPSLPTKYIGSKYTEPVHVTDWFPTVLSRVIDDSWSDDELDGYNIWDSIATRTDTPRTEIVHAIDDSEASIQVGYVKYRYGIDQSHTSSPLFQFSSDQNSDGYSATCVTPGFTAASESQWVDVDDIVYSSRTFYDLYTDPLEAHNRYGNSSYTEIQAILEARAEYWQTQVVDPSIPDTSVKHPTWVKCGGICPWLKADESFTPTEVKQVYKNEKAPHIVFALVDDWGWNDFGLRSTFMGWTTPNIDRLANEGVLLTNYYTSSTCVPSRGSFLTGRYPLRLGLWYASEGSELPLTETTIAEEMKSAGYRTNIVGKWHVGTSTEYHMPHKRGFDYSYVYLNGLVDYWTKEYGNFLDLHENGVLVSNEAEIDNTYHNGFLMQKKVEDVINDHATNYADQPMFLYYALQLIHGVWSAPDRFLSKCGVPSLEMVGTEYLQEVMSNYCALNVMLDEVIANLTCTLEANNMIENTVLLVVSDNGGESTIPGNSVPFRGFKGSYNRGGVSATALIHSQLLPTEIRGSTYDGLLHVSDWLPTFMGLATDKQWTGSLTGAVLDGMDVWDAITTNSPSPRTEIVHYADGDAGVVLQLGTSKLFAGVVPSDDPVVVYAFEEDLKPDETYHQCENPSLMYPAESSYGSMYQTLFAAMGMKSMASMESSVITTVEVLLISFGAVLMTAGVLLTISMAIRMLAPDLKSAPSKKQVVVRVPGDNETSSLLSNGSGKNEQFKVRQSNVVLTENMA